MAEQALRQRFIASEKDLAWLSANEYVEQTPGWGLRIFERKEIPPFPLITLWEDMGWRASIGDRFFAGVGPREALSTLLKSERRRLQQKVEHASCKLRDIERFITIIDKKSIDQAEHFLQITAKVAREPVESCQPHSAESDLFVLIGKAQESSLVEWILTSSIGGDFIRLIGRLEGLPLSFKQHLIQRGLQSTSIDIRDASLQAIEKWGDPEIVKLLHNYNDSEDWLTKYAQIVFQSYCK